MLYVNRVWERPVTWPTFCRPKMGRKWTISKRSISVITDIDDKWFVIFEHTINRLSFGYVRLPQLEYNFSSFFLLFLLFLLQLSTFKPVYTLYSKFEQLKISGRTNVGLKSGVLGRGIPSIASSKILTFQTATTRMDQILRIDSY